MNYTIEIETLLRNLGILAIYNKSSRKWFASCPNPIHRNTVDKSIWNNWIFKKDIIPSWGIIDNPGSKNHGSHFCHSCKFCGGPWELASVVWNCTVKEAGLRIVELFGKPTSTEVPSVVIRDISKKEFDFPFGVEFNSDLNKWYKPALKYLFDRNVTEEQIFKFNIGYSIKGRLSNRVVFPVYTEGKLRTFAARNILPVGKRYLAGMEVDGAEPKKALFGEHLLDYSKDIITVAEGCISTLALDRSGAINSVGMTGSYLTPDRARIISKFKNIIFATDPDNAGDNVSRMMESVGRYRNYYRLRLEKSPDDMRLEDLRVEIEKVFDFL